MCLNQTRLKTKSLKSHKMSWAKDIKLIDKQGKLIDRDVQLLSKLSYEEKWLIRKIDWHGKLIDDSWFEMALRVNGLTNGQC